MIRDVSTGAVGEAFSPSYRRSLDETVREESRRRLRRDLHERFEPPDVETTSEQAGNFLGRRLVDPERSANPGQDVSQNPLASARTCGLASAASKREFSFPENTT